MFISYLRPVYTKFPIEFPKALCTTIYYHIRALHEYDVTQVPKITTPVILLKPTVQSLRIPDEDYGLHKVLDTVVLKNKVCSIRKGFNPLIDFQITTGKVQAYCVEGNHASILDSDKVIAAINGQQIESVKKIQSNIIDNDKIISVESNRTRS